MENHRLARAAAQAAREAICSTIRGRAPPRSRRGRYAACTYTSRGAVPRAGPITPSDSIISTIFAARL